MSITDDVGGGLFHREIAGVTLFAGVTGREWIMVDSSITVPVEEHR